jgi:NAD dependent epimerase/dehydratase family enzyme
LNEFRKPVRFGVAAILGSGKQVISWIHIDDLARLLVYAIENDKIQGVYNAVASQPVTNRNFVMVLAEKIKGRFYIPFYVPSFVLKIMLGEMSVEVLKSATVSNTKISNKGFQFLFPTIEAALADLTKD